MAIGFSISNCCRLQLNFRPQQYSTSTRFLKHKYNNIISIAIVYIQITKRHRSSLKVFKKVDDVLITYCKYYILVSHKIYYFVEVFANVCVSYNILFIIYYDYSYTAIIKRLYLQYIYIYIPIFQEQGTCILSMTEFLGF